LCGVGWLGVDDGITKSRTADGNNLAGKFDKEVTKNAEFSFR
jgi:hypothetical protein